mgnify:CR=1 FL=1
MDYEDFLEQNKKFVAWNNNNGFFDIYDSYKVEDHSDHIENLVYGPKPKTDNVNSPSHYTQGKTEAIDIIEDAISGAPSVQLGMLQGQVLKYLLRLWFKKNPLEDAKKAQWYLRRLINKLEEG